MQIELYNFLKDLAAGGISGIVAKTVSAPVERVKLVLQTQHGNSSIPPDKRYNGPIDCFIRIIKEQGFMSYWRGNLTNVLRYFPNQAVNFAFNDKFKVFFLRNVKKEDYWSFIAGNLAAGGSAGAAALTLTHPLDVIRTRLAADVGSSKSSRQFRGIYHCARTILGQSGLSGIYKGFGVSLTGAAVFKALHLGGYSIAKTIAQLDNTSSIASKYAVAQVLTLVVGTMCYPFDTVKRRVMMQAEIRYENVHNKKSHVHENVSSVITQEAKSASHTPASGPVYRNARHCLYRIIADEGWLALFRGLSVNIVRGVSGAILLVAYDEVKVVFSRL